jgi:hypothetical protein
MLRYQKPQWYGGFVVFGFDDATFQPHPDNRPADVRAAFHMDIVQGIVSKYAQELFEVGIGFGVRDELEHAVIVVPEKPTTGSGFEVAP